MSDQIIVKVAQVYGDNTVLVLNKGAEDGIKSYHEFLIYEMGEEILDPDTKESLGRIEVIKGRGKVKHLQPRITVVESSKYDYEVETSSPKTMGSSNWFSQDKTERKVKITQPFDNPKIGDKVKILNN